MDFITIGEMVIDFLPGQEEGIYIRNAGGAPANVLACAARLGRRTAFIGKVGDDIIASDGGEVIYADWEEGYGYVVKIDHKNGYITFYAHCNELYVTKGQKVSKGDVIAALGNTGRSTGPHVHFEVRDSSSGKALNPLEFIEN